MKKFILIAICCLAFVMGYAQNTFTEVMLPQYIQGRAALPASVPYVFRAKFTGLAPNTLYRYVASALRATQPKTGVLTGIPVVMRDDTVFYKGSTVSAPTGNPGRFTTDANGDYTGWFCFLTHDGTSYRFVPGDELYACIVLGPPGGGVSPYERYFSTNTIKVIDWGTDAVSGTGIRSTAASGASAKDYVMLYDSETPVAGERPISGGFVEADGLKLSTASGTVNIADFYKTSVDEVDGAWGTIIPNNLPNGVRRIERYSFKGRKAVTVTSADGSWGGISTVNPSGAMAAPVVLDGSVITLAAPPRINPNLSFRADLPADVLTTDADFGVGATTVSPVAIQYTSSNTAVATIDAAGLIHIVGAGTTVIKAEQEENDDYNPASITHTLNVTVPKIGNTLAFPANFPLTVLKTAADFNAGVTTNAPAAITYMSSDAAVATIDANGLVHITGVGVTEVSAEQVTDATYEGALVKITLTVVDKQVPVVTFLPISGHIYGDAAFDISASATSGATAVFSTNNPAVAVIENGKVRITGAGTVTITAAFPATTDYSTANGQQTFIVQKKPLSIIAEDQTKTEGAVNPVLTARYEGFVNGDNNISGLTTQPQLATTVGTATTYGSYAITINGAASNNYSISYVPGVFTVTPLQKDNTITFGPLSQRVYGQADFESGAVVNSGLKVELSGDNPAVAVVAGTKIHIVGAGTVTITANQPGDPNHPAATPVSQMLTVRKALLTIQPKDTTKKQGEVNPDFELLHYGFVNSENTSVLTVQATGVTNAGTNATAGIYNITASGATAANYDIVYQPGKFTVLPIVSAGANDLVAYCDAPGRLRVSLYVQEAGKTNIQVFDATGRRVVHLPVTLVKGYNIYTLDVSALAAGIYPVRVAGEKLDLKTKAVIR